MNKAITKLKYLKCKLGYHNEVLLGGELPFYSKLLFKCKHCGKYGLYYCSTENEVWTYNIECFPKVVQNHIKENNL